MRGLALRDSLPNVVLVASVGIFFMGATAVPANSANARSEQWQLDAMHTEEMWNSSKGAGVTVAVIDSGVDDSLPGLRGQVSPGKNLSSLTGSAKDDEKGHGTSMASLVAGTGAGDGLYGLAPKSRILPVRIDSETKGSNAAEQEERLSKRLDKAIRYAAGSDAKILNISLGGYGKGNSRIDSAVKYALDHGKMVFASTGNDGDKGNPVHFPAATPGVIGVGAVDKQGKVADESVRGPQTDLVAPGKDVVHECKAGNGVCKGTGTSASAAIASASAALIWSKHPNWTANQVTRVLVNTAGGPKSGDKRNDFIGHGAVRPRIALKDPGDPGDPKTNPLPGPYYEGNKESSKAEKKPLENSNSQQQKASSEEDGNNFGQVAGYVFGAVVVLAASIGTPLLMHRLRRRRSRRTYL